MKKKWRVIFLFLCGLTVQCTGSLTRTVETTYFEIRYPYQQVDCTQRLEKGLRIRPFSENIPYDRNDMVVLGPQRDVQLSFKNQWVGRPGDMIAQKLAEDLTRGPLFSRIFTTRDSFAAPLEMDGKIFLFAWAEENSEASALMDVEVKIIDQEEAGKVLFNKRYRLQSPRHPRRDPAIFAEAISILVQQFSIALRKDLCAALNGGRL